MSHICCFVSWTSSTGSATSPSSDSDDTFGSSRISGFAFFQISRYLGENSNGTYRVKRQLIICSTNRVYIFRSKFQQKSSYKDFQKSFPFWADNHCTDQNQHRQSHLPDLLRSVLSEKLKLLNFPTVGFDDISKTRENFNET